MPWNEIVTVKRVLDLGAQRRDVLKLLCLLQFFIHSNQPVRRGVVGSSAGAVEYSVQPGFQGKAWPLPALGAEMWSPRPDPLASL